MKAGTTERFDCGGCQAEFEITYEPKAKGMSATSIAAKPVTTCPFCGDALESDTDASGDEEEDAG